MLDEPLEALARAPRLLVACDYDGTLSELAPEPDAARPNPRAVAALERLANMPRTHVALISGRPLTWLRPLLAHTPGVRRFGSHGAEDGSTTAAVYADMQENLRRLANLIDEPTLLAAGARIERKPMGLAVHYRHASSPIEVIHDVETLANANPNLLLRRGAGVVELCLSRRHKGDALDQVRRETQATHAVFFGDDTTDEDAFACLRDEDLAIKVGPGKTRASRRLLGVEDVATVLDTLATLRAQWIHRAPADSPTDG